MVYRQADFAEVFEMKMRLQSSRDLLTFDLPIEAG